MRKTINPKTKKLLVIITLITALVFLRTQVRAFDLGQTIELLKSKILGSDYLEQLEEGEFLLEGAHPNFQAFFGDRVSNGRHRVKLTKDNLGFEFAFLEAIISSSPTSTISASLASNKTATSEADLNEEQKKILGDLEIQLEEIETTQASIEAKLDYLHEELNSIDKEINQVIPGTDIGYDEVNKDQLVVKNSNLQTGIDIYYWKRENDLREKIIIRYPPAPDRIIFTLKNQDLTPFDIGAGVIYFKDKDGNYLFRIGKGYIKDLANAFSNLVMTRVEDNQLIHQLDRRWLDEPSRIYPLTVYFDFQLINQPGEIKLVPEVTRSASFQPTVTPIITASPSATISVTSAITPTANPASLPVSLTSELSPTITATPEPTETATPEPTEAFEPNTEVGE
jgi:hypothetical protein